MSEFGRRRIILRGIVQGVGMRPFIASVASAFNVTGFCGNSDTEVFVEAQGERVDEFAQALVDKLPPLAHVMSREVTTLAPVPGEEAFNIRPSQHTPGEKTLIPPDVAMCADCAAEIHDSTNRRYRYPFTTCTNCGPRLSIITSLPYDRPNTTLSVFPLCPQCQREYSDPTDRRFHAQPISCPDCGPRCWIEQGGMLIDDPFDQLVMRVRKAWDAGEIVAVRGIGGFHLTCDATDPHAVARLREKKSRPTKPLAVMVPDLTTAHELGVVDDETLLAGPARPIVTVPVGQRQLAGIAPGLNSIGLMLPYSPLHQLLVDRPIVATSGNPSGEPVCFTNEQARVQLAHLCDMFLMHDREIHVPVEDSVFLGKMPIRRSRGFAPVPVPIRSGPTVLAVGGELKNTFTLAVGGYAHVSAHVGDMGSWTAQGNFERAVDQMLSMRNAHPELVVADLHPGYATTNWAQRFVDKHGLELALVQHHHAHALSLLASHGRIGERAAVATLDGTGYGTDGTIWGGEVLTILPDGSFERSWHLPTFGIVGGDRAVKHPWRLALALCHRAGQDMDISGIDQDELTLVRSQLTSGVGVVETSSTGRLFDAVAYLLGAVTEVTYEGEAAMKLEALATGDAPLEPASTWEEMIARVVAPGERRYQARQFHRDLAWLISRELVKADTPAVGLSGGSAYNTILARDIAEFVGHPLLQHTTIPAGDGGLSLGQAVAGRLLADSR
ncbi:carbamoyltransferase HypF [Corynebacterium breve]|uniref:Carbamoyltransferase n=1 Tax=Corynebacterium breve TaxID=3049799 RepID=A0ABY8VI47_9CORY|nr:carbamoyltransferase HypF [Corynebacterium breve]WIM68288.1 carbamoyltransferase HypF [Corynebacterium breve]